MVIDNSLVSAVVTLPHNHVQVSRQVAATTRQHHEIGALQPTLNSLDPNHGITSFY